MDRRLSLQQQMGSGLHQVHSSPNITSPSSNNSQPTHPPQPPAAPPAPPASAAPPAPPGRFLFLYNFHGIDPDACNQSRLFCCRISPALSIIEKHCQIFLCKNVCRTHGLLMFCLKVRKFDMSIDFNMHLIIFLVKGY